MKFQIQVEDMGEGGPVTCEVETNSDQLSAEDREKLIFAMEAVLDAVKKISGGEQTE